MRALLVEHLRARSGRNWLVFFAAIVAAWTALFLMSVPGELRDLGMYYGRDIWISLCTMTPDAAGFGKMFAMWALMSAAMMAPTAFPAFATYEDLSGHAPEARFGVLVSGYMLIWLVFALIAAFLQLALVRVDLVSVFGDSRSNLLSGVLLIVAGGYQFAPLKEACLSRCRRPLTFFMQHWEEGAWRMGLRLGLTCLGCCWALMLLGFVGGVMNLSFMGIATLFMVLEKLPEIGRWLTRPMGACLLLAGMGMIATSL